MRHLWAKVSDFWTGSGLISPISISSYCDRNPTNIPNLIPISAGQNPSSDAIAGLQDNDFTTIPVQHGGGSETRDSCSYHNHLLALRPHCACCLVRGRLDQSGGFEAHSQVGATITRFYGTLAGSGRGNVESLSHSELTS